MGLFGVFGGFADEFVVVGFFEFFDGAGEFFVFFDGFGDFGFPEVAVVAEGIDVDGLVEEFGKAAGDGFDGEGVFAGEVAGDFGDEADHFDVVGGGLGDEEGGERGGAVVVGGAEAVFGEGVLEVGVGDGAEHAGFAGVGDGAAEGAHEDDAGDVDGFAKGKDGVGESLPFEVGLGAEEEDEVGGGVDVEDVAGHFGGAADEAVLHFDFGAEDGGDLHGAGEVEDVKGVGIDAGDFGEGAVFHEAFDGAGGDVAAVHPAGEGEEEGGAGEGGEEVGVGEVEVWGHRHLCEMGTASVYAGRRRLACGCLRIGGGREN
jgi:hypothetical protein